MKRVLSATCFAAMCAVGLAAQSTTGTTGTSTAPDQGGQGRGGPRSFSGCLRAGDTTGTYMLTDVQMVAADTTAGSTAGSTAAGSTAAGSTAGTTGGGMGRAGQMPTTLMLTTSAADVDLKAHVGHKIEVTGTMAGGGRRAGADTAGSTAGSTTGSTSGSTSGSTAGGTGTSAAGATAQGGARTRTLNVTAVKMVSESCS